MNNIDKILEDFSDRVSVYIENVGTRRIIATYFRVMLNQICQQTRQETIKECIDSLPNEIGANGFLLTREARFGDKEDGFNECLKEAKENLNKLK